MDRQEHDIPLDARMLGDAVIELNIARRNVSIYPPGHPSIAQSLSRALEKLEKIFSLRDSITLAVTADSLVVDEHQLDRKNAVFRDFATHLHSLGISYITFKKGIDENELLSLNEKILSRSKKEGSIKDTELAEIERCVGHVEVGLIDFASLRIEEGEAKETETGEGLWERYIYGLLRGTLAPGDAESVITAIPPQVLSRLLNTVKERNHEREANYDRVIASYLRRSTSRTLAPGDVKKVVKLIEGLKPELKSQFLSMTISFFPTKEDDLAPALGGLSIGEIERFLSLIQEHSVKIPDTLKNLIEKFSQVDESLTEMVFLGENLLLDDIIVREDVTLLMKEGKINEFVTDEYRSQMEKILAYTPTEGAEAPKRIHSVALSEEETERDRLEVLSELLEACADDEGTYEKLLESFLSTLEEVISAGDIPAIVRSIELIEKHCREGPFREKARETEKKLHEEKFLFSFTEALRVAGRREREGALLLVSKFGNELLPHLMDTLTEEEDSTVRKFLIEAIAETGTQGAVEAAKRLEDPRWYVVRNMLFIISLRGNREIAEKARPFLVHENEKVRVEAFRCLLKHGDGKAKRLLMEHLDNPKGSFFTHALSLAGKFQVREAAGPICAFLLKKSTTGKDFEEKHFAVRVLAEIGDPQAVNVFRKILGEKSVLFKSALDSLKETIFLNLRYFPPDAVEDLLRMGTKSGNEKVRRECANLLKKEGR